MAGRTMKTSYYLIALAGLAAVGAVVYTRLNNTDGPRTIPSLPVPSDPAPPPITLTAAPLPPVNATPLPPIKTPAQDPLLIPASGITPPDEKPLPIPPVAPATIPLPPPSSPSTLPVPPVEVPPVPKSADAPMPIPPALIPPMVPPDLVPPPLPNPPALPPVSSVPPIDPAQPALPQPATQQPLLPPPLTPTTPNTVGELPKPPVTMPMPPPPPLPGAQLPPPTPLSAPPVQLTSSGQFVVLKGNKLIEGTVTVTGEKVVVRQGVLDRSLSKADVHYIGQTRDDVYRFMLSQVSATDPSARLAVARWCMLNGLREQALTEAREVLKLQPTNTAAADVARSLEESLKQFPADGSLPKPSGGRLVTEPEPDVTPESSTTFATRAQPVLANQCMECHARPDYSGEFKLLRVTGFEVGPQSTLANLRATAAQLKKDDPLNSPLLVKALTMHGGMKQPAFVSRQAGGYRVLEAWVLQAVGPTASPMTPPVQPVLPPTPPVPPIPPAIDGPAPAPVGLPNPPASVLPPIEPLPATVPPVLPTPPSIPPADPSTRSTPPVLPAIPSIPVLPSTPAASSGQQPAGRSQFGTAPKPIIPPSGPSSGDEFDPTVFNKQLVPQK